MYTLYLNGEVYATIDYIPIVGDSYEDFIIWEVDYHERTASLCK